MERTRIGEQPVNASLVVPVYNEEDNLAELAERSVQTCEAVFGSNMWEILLIDDHSTDSSLSIALDLEKRFAGIRSVARSHRGGQTGCFEIGFRLARGKVVITMDGDLQVFPEDIPILIRKLEDGYDLVNATRESRQDTVGIRLSSKMYNLLMRVFFKCPVRDAASNFTAVRREFLKGLNLFDNDHRYLIPILQHRGVQRMAEVSVRHQARKRGRSKYTLMKSVTGFPELILALRRIRSGRYDIDFGSGRYVL